MQRSFKLIKNLAWALHYSEMFILTPMYVPDFDTLLPKYPVLQGKGLYTYVPNILYAYFSSLEFNQVKSREKQIVNLYLSLVLI